MILMGVYLDTSALVSMHFKKPRTQAVPDWLNSVRSADLVISQWTLTEFSSAAAFKLRMKQITAEEETAGRALFSEMLAELLTVVDVPPSDFASAAGLCRQKNAPPASWGRAALGGMQARQTGDADAGQRSCGCLQVSWCGC